MIPSFMYLQSKNFREIMELSQNTTSNDELGQKVRQIVDDYKKPRHSLYPNDPDIYSEYLKYCKQVVDKFSEMLSVGNDYMDYINSVQEKNPDTYFNFRMPHEQSLIDMMINHTFEDSKDIMEKIQARQKEAQEWLSNHSMSFEQWIEKKKNDDKMGEAPTR